MRNIRVRKNQFSTKLIEMYYHKLEKKFFQKSSRITYCISIILGFLFHRAMET